MMEPPAPPPSSAAPGPTVEQWKVILHLSGLAGIPFPFGGNIIAPLIIWLVKKPGSPALDAEGRKVLNFQISYFLYAVLASAVAGSLIFLLIPLAVPVLVFVAWLIFTVLGAVKVSNGEEYRFPLVIRIL